MSNIESAPAEEKSVATSDRRSRLSFTDVVAGAAFALSAGTLYWTSLRPANVIPAFASVTVTEHGGDHISIPITISNDGARSASIFSAKLLESLHNDATLYDLGLETTPEKAADAEFGILAKHDVSPFVPFTLPPNGEVQKVLIFTPVTDGRLRAKSSQTVTYTIVFRTTVGDVRLKENVRWPSATDAILARGSGVSSVIANIADWQQQSP